MHFIEVFVLCHALSLNTVYPHVIFAGNVEDFRNIAKKFIPGSLADQLASIMSERARKNDDEKNPLYGVKMPMNDNTGSGNVQRQNDAFADEDAAAGEASEVVDDQADKYEASHEMVTTMDPKNQERLLLDSIIKEYTKTEAEVTTEFNFEQLVEKVKVRLEDHFDKKYKGGGGGGGGGGSGGMGRTRKVNHREFQMRTHPTHTLRQKHNNEFRYDTMPQWKPPATTKKAMDDGLFYDKISLVVNNDTYDDYTPDKDKFIEAQPAPKQRIDLKMVNSYDRYKFNRPNNPEIQQQQQQQQQQYAPQFVQNDEATRSDGAVYEQTDDAYATPEPDLKARTESIAFYEYPEEAQTVAAAGEISQQVQQVAQQQIPQQQMHLIEQQPPLQQHSPLQQQQQQFSLQQQQSPLQQQHSLLQQQQNPLQQQQSPLQQQYQHQVMIKRPINAKNSEAVKAVNYGGKGTGVPTRYIYKMTTPNYYISQPTIAERYDFDEPIPENDREPENLKYFPNVPAKINAKVKHARQ